MFLQCFYTGRSSSHIALGFFWTRRVLNIFYQAHGTASFLGSRSLKKVQFFCLQLQTQLGPVNNQSSCTPCPITSGTRLDPWQSQKRPDPENGIFVQMPLSQICPDCTRPTRHFQKFVRTSDQGFFLLRFVQTAPKSAWARSNT